MRYSRVDILENLNNCINDRKPIIGVATGSGRTARHAEKGKADLILVLNAGHFRLMGLSSIAGMMPYENSNARVLEFGGSEITTIIKKTPVMFGLCATDPTIDISDFIDKIVCSGFSGINNFPTVGLIDGQYREALEEQGLGYDHEVNAIKIAHEKNIFTIAFVFDEQQAVKMSEAGADVICVHLGFTVGGTVTMKNFRTMDESVKLTNGIFKKVQALRPEIIKMVYGGHISTPMEAEEFYALTGVDGYIGGSSFERIPTENIITEITEQFKTYGVLKEENQRLKDQLEKKHGFDDIVGNASTMQDLYHVIHRVADKKVNVLIQGESGTGKELIAKALHINSKRKNDPFIKINCAAIPENLFESELFGYEQGAFTGAVSKKIGRFELANNGTLFLDEIGELPMKLQAKLLRAIQQQEFERVGGNKTIKVDVRIIAATNKDLLEEVNNGQFRSDLYYRLNVISVFMPPLRERLDDLPALIKELLRRINDKFDTKITKIDNKVVEAFMQYDWPGNVRELENTLERSVIMADSETLQLEYLPAKFKEFITKDSEKADDYNLETNETCLISKVLEKTNRNVSQSAVLLGITRKTLQIKIKKHNL